MEHNGGELDERELRAAQGAIAVLLFGAFVFQLPELVYGVTVIVAVSAAFGPRANAFASAFRMLVTPRLRPPLEVVTVASARALDIAETGLLVVASLAFFANIDIVGVFLALVTAAVATVHATTGFNAATAVFEWMKRAK